MDFDVATLTIDSWTKDIHWSLALHRAPGLMRGADKSHTEAKYLDALAAKFLQRASALTYDEHDERTGIRPIISPIPQRALCAFCIDLPGPHCVHFCTLSLRAVQLSCRLERVAYVRVCSYPMHAKDRTAGYAGYRS